MIETKIRPATVIILLSLVPGLPIWLSGKRWQVLVDLDCHRARDRSAHPVSVADYLVSGLCCLPGADGLQCLVIYLYQS